MECGSEGLVEEEEVNKREKKRKERVGKKMDCFVLAPHIPIISHLEVNLQIYILSLLNYLLKIGLQLLKWCCGPPNCKIRIVNP